jgi:hypothetical protein
VQGTGHPKSMYHASPLGISVPLQAARGCARVLSIAAVNLLHTPVVLTLCDYYAPGFKGGGTPRTVARLARRGRLQVLPHLLEVALRSLGGASTTRATPCAEVCTWLGFAES